MGKTGTTTTAPVRSREEILVRTIIAGRGEVGWLGLAERTGYSAKTISRAFCTGFGPGYAQLKLAIEGPGVGYKPVWSDKETVRLREKFHNFLGKDPMLLNRTELEALAAAMGISLPRQKRSAEGHRKVLLAHAAVNTVLELKR